MDQRTPPKFVPTLTELAAHEADAAAAEAAQPNAPALLVDGQCQPADQAGDVADPGDAPHQRQRQAVNLVDAHGSAAHADIDIASLPTQLGWAQPVGGAVAFGAVHAQGVLPASTAPTHIDTHSTAPVLVQPFTPQQELPATHVSGLVDQDIAATPDRQAVAASLVASAADVAQALEEAITHRVLKRVQARLEAQLSGAALQVVQQQTALFQSALQLQIDATIRETIAQAVADVADKHRGSDI